MSGNRLLFAEESPSLRIDPPVDTQRPSVLRYDPLVKGDDLSLDGPFYQSDAVKAALAYLPPDLKLGPSDFPDYAEQDRMERLGDYVKALGRIPKVRATILGMPCDLTSPLGFTCHIPGTDCITGIGFPPAFLCPF